MLEGLSGSQAMFAAAAAVLECCVSRGLLFPECKGIADLRQTLEETLRHLLKSLEIDIVKSWSYGPPGFHLWVQLPARITYWDPASKIDPRLSFCVFSLEGKRDRESIWHLDCVWVVSMPMGRVKQEIWPTHSFKIKDRHKVKEVGTRWHLYSLLPVSPSEGLAFFRKVISESLLQKDGAVWGERCFQGYWTIVTERGAYCVQSVEAKDAATAKHPPNAHPRQRILWVQSQVSGLLRVRNARELSWSSIVYIQRRIRGLITKSKEKVCSENNPD